MKKSKFPRVFMVPNRKIDDQYYLCNNVEDILASALESFNTLRDMSLIYDMEEPDPDRYGEVTDEMIENAPSQEVRSALNITKMKRDDWLSGSTWNSNSLKREQYMYNFFVDAKKGNAKAAYQYLTELELFKEIDLNRHG